MLALLSDVAAALALDPASVAEVAAAVCEVEAEAAEP